MQKHRMILLCHPKFNRQSKKLLQPLCTLLMIKIIESLMLILEAVPPAHRQSMFNISSSPISSFLVFPSFFFVFDIVTNLNPFFYRPVRKCWLESSFVGNKPMDSPQTPVLDTSFSGRDSSLGLPNASARVNGVGESRLL